MRLRVYRVAALRVAVRAVLLRAARAHGGGCEVKCGTIAFAPYLCVWLVARLFGRLRSPMPVCLRAQLVACGGGVVSVACLCALVCWLD